MDGTGRSGIGQPVHDEGCSGATEAEEAAPHAPGTAVAPVMKQDARHVRHKSGLALVLVDVVNHFEFPDGKSILRQALAIAPGLARLKKRARKAGIPAIYVNDNFGQWRSDQSKLLKYCLRPEAAGRPFVEQLRPDDKDYFVLKP